MVTTDIPNSENQLDWLKGIRYRSNCQKTDSTDVAEHKKPVYNNMIVRRRTILIYRIQTSVPKFFCPQRSSLCQQQNTKDPYLTYIGDSIRATHLGGCRSVYMFADGGSPFSLGFFLTQACQHSTYMCEASPNLEIRTICRA